MLLLLLWTRVLGLVRFSWVFDTGTARLLLGERDPYGTEENDIQHKRETNMLLLRVESWRLWEVWIQLIAHTFYFQRVSALFFLFLAALVGFLFVNHVSMYCSCIYRFYFLITFSLNEFHGTIYTFKNYFVIVFSVLTK